MLYGNQWLMIKCLNPVSTVRLHSVNSAVAAVAPDKLVVYLFAARSDGTRCRYRAPTSALRGHDPQALRPPSNQRECLGVSLPAL